jgi:hypothetical protein
MTETPKPGSLLEELDRRQDEVLEQLDDLNLKIEALLNEWLVTRAQVGSDASVSA